MNCCRLTGTNLNNTDNVTVVPLDLADWHLLISCPFWSNFKRFPGEESDSNSDMILGLGKDEVWSVWVCIESEDETDANADNASPLNPKVLIDSRSLNSLSFEVWCGWQMNTKFFSGIPWNGQPMRHEWCWIVQVLLAMRHEWYWMVQMLLAMRHEWCYIVQMLLAMRHEWCYIVQMLLAMRHEWCYIVQMLLAIVPHPSSIT